MIESEELKKELKEIADILNQFKSEAVQLKVLDMLTARMGSPPGTTTAQTRKVARGPKTSKKEESSTEQSQKQTRASSVPRTFGSGAHSIILRLLEEGFFDKAQTIGSITKHASERLGHRLKANECSPSLLRLLRTGKLTRAKNADGQYEYTKA